MFRDAGDRAYPAPVISGAQILAARALLGMQQGDLARRAGVSVNTLSAIERRASNPLAGTLAAIEAALIAEGIVFLSDGVRLRRPAR
jgi:transcriptional regulator with XRE-family HTH domain